MQVEIVKFDFAIYASLEIARKKLLEHLVVECRRSLQDSLVGYIYGAQLEDGSPVHVCCSQYYGEGRDVEFAKSAIRNKENPSLIEEFRPPTKCRASLELTMTALSNGTAHCTGKHER